MSAPDWRHQRQWHYLVTFHLHLLLSGVSSWAWIMIPVWEGSWSKVVTSCPGHNSVWDCYLVMTADTGEAGHGNGECRGTWDNDAWEDYKLVPLFVAFMYTFALVTITFGVWTQFYIIWDKNLNWQIVSGLKRCRFIQADNKKFCFDFLTKYIWRQECHLIL